MIAKTVKKNGLVKIDIDGEIFEPVAFMTYRPDARTFADFQRAGVRFASFGAYAPDHGINEYAGLFPMTPNHFWIGEDTYDFSEIDRNLEMICPTGKEMFVFPRVYLNTPSWWERKYPEELCCDDAGMALHESFASEQWREDAARALRALMDHINGSKWRDCVVGYHIAAGSTEEWTYHHYTGEIFRLDYSAPNHKKFVAWLEKKYETVEALNASWKKAYVDFSKAEFPSTLARCYSLNGALRDVEREMQTIDFWQYTNELFAETIVYFCHVVKEYSQNTRLAGAFYGYNIFLIHPDKGHFALSKVLESPDVDFIAATGNHPEPGGAWTSNATLSSPGLRGKLFFCEGDIRTHLTRPLGERLPHVVSKNNYYKTPVWRPLASMELSISAIKKASARVLTDGVAVWWFDMFGGAFDCAEIMHLFELFVKQMQLRTEAPLKRDIAYVIDEEALRYLRRNDSPADDLNRKQIDSMSHMGAPFDMYEAQDLLCDDFPEDQYRLVILSGFLHPTKEIRGAIDQKLRKKGKTLLWCQFTDDSLSGAVTLYDPYAVAVRGQFKDTCFPETAVSAPRFAESMREEGYCLATVAGSTEPAVMAFEGERETNIVSIVPNLPANLLRDIATIAGAHLYTRKDDVIYAGGNFIGIHACTAGEKRIQLPFPVKALVEVETGERPFLFDGIHTDIEMKEFETRLYRIET